MPTVLDLATGTGDLAMMIADLHPGVHVIGTDPSKGMLEVAEAKGRAATADVTIDTAKVVEVRTSVIDRLTELGAGRGNEAETGGLGRGEGGGEDIVQGCRT